MRDLASNLYPVGALFPKAATTDNTAFTSGIIDLAGYDGACIILITGTDADSDATFAFTMEHGDDSALADTAAPATTDLVGTLSQAGYDFAADNKTRKIGYIGSKRYIRFTITPSNNTGNVFLAAAVVLGHPKLAPTASVPA